MVVHASEETVTATIVNLTIDGQTVQTRQGQTIIQAAEAAGIHIPSLCHHGLLPSIGACRQCLVEIEKQRALHPACTFPVAEGLVVRTQTPALVEARLMNLNLLFSERAHYCMFCPSSGTAETTDCELQRLGYQSGITAWPYPPNTAESRPVDASHPYLVLDPSRCVLCRRCVRACDVIAANHTLGVHQRGAKAVIGADDGLPLGKSSCISCGVCTEFCPTGALTDRLSAFAGHDSQLQWVKSICMGCAVGCGIHAGTRDNRLVRINGDWDAPSAGLLCSTGRFETREPPRPARILNPRIRHNGTFIETSWDDALKRAAAGFRSAQSVAGLASPRLPGESLAAFACLFQEVLHSDEVGLIYGETPPMDIGQPAALTDIAEADFVAVIGGDPLRYQKVVGYLVKRAFDRQASILVVNGGAANLAPYAKWYLHLEDLSASSESPFARLRHAYHLNISGLKQLRSAAAEAKRPVVIYAGGLSTTVYSALQELPAHVRFLPLVQGTNTRGAARLGLTARSVADEALYVLAGDDISSAAVPPEISTDRSKHQFVVVQAAYESHWTARADVVLPARLWSEQSGHIVTLDGQARSLHPLINAPASVRSDRQAILDLASQLGHSLTYEEIPGVMNASAIAGDRL